MIFGRDAVRVDAVAYSVGHYDCNVDFLIYFVPFAPSTVVCHTNSALNINFYIHFLIGHNELNALRYILSGCVFIVSQSNLGSAEWVELGWMSCVVCTFDLILLSTLMDTPMQTDKWSNVLSPNNRNNLCVCFFCAVECRHLCANDTIVI